MKIKDKMRKYAIQQLDTNIHTLVDKVCDDKESLEVLTSILLKHLDTIGFWLSLAEVEDTDE